MNDNITGLDLAHSYLDAGLWVLPIKPKKKEPYTSLAPHGHLSATNNHKQLDAWINYDPDMNLGIACEMSDLIVLDFDYRNMGDEANNFYSECAYRYYENTLVVHTGNGFHYYFRCESALDVKSKYLDGVDIKYRGYVVAPPSLHPNGKEYTCNYQEISPVPAGLLKEISK